MKIILMITFLWILIVGLIATFPDLVAANPYKKMMKKEKKKKARLDDLLHQ